MKEKKKVGGPIGNKYAIGNSGGRPEINIDWNYVEKLLEAGCSGAGIAPIIGLNEDTLYRRCLKDKSITFSELSRQMHSKGDDLLRKVQYDKALSGENTLLIWLGKVRLKQSEIIQSSGEVKVTVVDYSKSESDSNTPQISTQTISTSCSAGT